MISPCFQSHSHQGNQQIRFTPYAFHILLIGSQAARTVDRIVKRKFEESSEVGSSLSSTIKKNKSAGREGCGWWLERR
ncbi:unnamed protein product [Sympodiomycopsis kandeliae]